MGSKLLYAQFLVDAITSYIPQNLSHMRDSIWNLIDLHNPHRPLIAHHLIHIYMPTYSLDTPLIPNIQLTIFNLIHNNPQSINILLEDFNRDIALIGKQNAHTITKSTQQDKQWRQFTNSVHLEYILNDSKYTH